MRSLAAVLVSLVLVLQFTLWLGDDGIVRLNQLSSRSSQQVLENDFLRQRNAAVEADVVDLKTGLDSVEERARSELGLVQADETFYQIIED